MKHLKTLSILSVIAIAIFAFSCGSGGGNAPGDVVKKAYDKIESGDYEAAVALYVKKDGEDLSEDETKKLTAMMPMAESEWNKNDGFDKVEITKETIAEDGETAEVEFDIIYKNGEKDQESIDLMKVDGKWRMLL